MTVRADSTDNMSSVGKAAEDILNTGIQNEKNKSNFKYKAEDIMEKVKNLQKLSESTNQQLIWIASIDVYKRQDLVCSQVRLRTAEVFVVSMQKVRAQCRERRSISLLSS